MVLALIQFRTIRLAGTIKFVDRYHRLIRLACCLRVEQVISIKEITMQQEIN
jgi:hypothetical protein